MIYEMNYSFIPCPNKLRTLFNLVEVNVSQKSVTVEQELLI